MDLNYVRENGDVLFFRNIDGEMKNMQKFVTFLGDTGKIGYKENFLDSGLMSEKKIKALLHYSKPGGPSPRTLSLFTSTT